MVHWSKSFREKCPKLEFLWSVFFSGIWTEYRNLLQKSPYSAQIRENTEQKNSKYGYFLRSEWFSLDSSKKKNQILLSAPYQDLSYPKSLISLLYSPFTRNVNELSHNVSVLMILIGNEFLGVRKRLPEIELHIFLSCE